MGIVQVGGEGVGWSLCPTEQVAEAENKKNAPLTNKKTILSRLSVVTGSGHFGSYSIRLPDLDLTPQPKIGANNISIVDQDRDPGGYKEMSSIFFFLLIATTYMSSNARGGGGVAGSQPLYSCTQEPKKIWRSNSIFN